MGESILDSVFPTEDCGPDDIVDEILAEEVGDPVSYENFMDGTRSQHSVITCKAMEHSVESELAGKPLSDKVLRRLRNRL